jgi:phage-related protein
LRTKSNTIIGMAEAPDRKPLIWMGRSRKDIGEFPDRVKGELGYGLDLAQAGEKHENAKPLRGCLKRLFCYPYTLENPP